MVAMKYFLLMSVAVITSLKADLVMEVKPPRITPGLTNTLAVTCAFNHSEITNLVNLVSMDIMRSNDSDHSRYNLVASVDAFGGIYNNSGDISGLIDNRHDSYLNLTWNNPKSDLAGFYLCEANGQNLHGQGVTISKLAQIEAAKPEVDDLLHVVQQQSSFLNQQSSLLELQSSALARQSSKLDFQTAEISKLQDDLRRLSLSVVDTCTCCERFNKSLQAEYQISDVHDGKRYYLSPVSNVLVMKEAERQCELMGGYLAETDSEDEYLFIKNFVSGHHEYEDVYLGGTDEAAENHWVNTYSHTPVQYIKWGYHQPDQGRSSNCLSLYRYNGWTMSDSKCFSGVTDKPVAYLCEVPE